MQKLAFVYGWSSGPKHGRKIMDSIQKYGFELSASIDKADILLAHSLGSFSVSRNANPKLAVLVDPPYWPGKSLRQSLIENIRAEDTYSRGRLRALKMIISQIFYIIKDLPRSGIGLLRRRKLIFPRAENYLIFRNNDDAFCSPDIKKVMPQEARLIELPGFHGDIYRYPDRYLKLVKEYADKLA